MFGCCVLLSLCLFSVYWLVFSCFSRVVTGSISFFMGFYKKREKKNQPKHKKKKPELKLREKNWFSDHQTNSFRTKEL
jgi:hypothetical protein